MVFEWDAVKLTGGGLEEENAMTGLSPADGRAMIRANARPGGVEDMVTHFALSRETVASMASSKCMSFVT